MSPIGRQLRAPVAIFFLAAALLDAGPPPAAAPAPPAPAVGATNPAAALDAAARAAGNRRPAAVALGTALFGRIRPAQVMKVRMDGAGSHEVAGLVLSGVKFHGRLDRAGFTAEVADLVRTAFASGDVEEVDCWATVPLPRGARVIVTGDMAQPTSRTVFAVTVRRSERATFAERLRRGTGVFWDPRFAARLQRGVGPGSSGAGD